MRNFTAAGLSLIIAIATIASDSWGAPALQAELENAKRSLSTATSFDARRKILRELESKLDLKYAAAFKSGNPTTDEDENVAVTRLALRASGLSQLKADASRKAPAAACAEAQAKIARLARPLLAENEADGESDAQIDGVLELAKVYCRR